MKYAQVLGPHDTPKKDCVLKLHGGYTWEHNPSTDKPQARKTDQLIVGLTHTLRHLRLYKASAFLPPVYSLSSLYVVPLKEPGVRSQLMSMIW